MDIEQVQPEEGYQELEESTARTALPVEMDASYDSRSRNAESDWELYQSTKLSGGTTAPHNAEFQIASSDLTHISYDQPLFCITLPNILQSEEQSSLNQGSPASPVTRKPIPRTSQTEEQVFLDQGSHLQA
jgi:hypothetical protein